MPTPDPRTLQAFPFVMELDDQVEQEDGTIVKTGEKRSFAVPGMFLRDYFAAAALASIMSVAVPPEDAARVVEDPVFRARLKAEEAYRIADEMILARADGARDGDLAILKPSGGAAIAFPDGEPQVEP